MNGSGNGSRHRDAPSEEAVPSLELVTQKNPRSPQDAKNEGFINRRSRVATSEVQLSRVEVEGKLAPSFRVGED